VTRARPHQPKKEVDRAISTTGLAVPIINRPTAYGVVTRRLSPTRPQDGSLPFRPSRDRKPPSNLRSHPDHFRRLRSRHGTESLRPDRPAASSPVFLAVPGSRGYRTYQAEATKFRPDVPARSQERRRVSYDRNTTTTTTTTTTTKPSCRQADRLGPRVCVTRSLEVVPARHGRSDQPTERHTRTRRPTPSHTQAREAFGLPWHFRWETGRETLVT